LRREDGYVLAKTTEKLAQFKEAVMNQSINRRQFIKYAGGGIAALVVGTRLSWVFENPVYVAAAVQTIELEIGDAIKQMVTHNSININPNPALCYFWIYKSVNPDLPAECPGPTIFATKGDTINIAVTNSLDEPHAFFIPGMVDSGPIAPGARWPATGTFSFTASKSGAHLYFDNLNAPVNRVMGLHGALVVMPVAPAVGHKFTPYDAPTPAVQKLFDDFGSSAHFPGLAWEQGDPNAASFAPPFRTYVWIDHQASPNLFQRVGSLAPGVIQDAAVFVNDFLRSAFDPTNSAAFMGAQYFTINGQSGHFSHGSPFICPNLRVGEPCVVHILNAGLWTHSMHVHANHFYVTSDNGVVQENPLWVDTFEVEPMEAVDYILPYMRPPDVPNARGIGLPDTPLTSLANPLIPGSTPHPVWPPTEELSFAMPAFSLLPLPPGVITLV
jgi:FtsP/CotA-like multicopper oxidase with cupredoxin domain